MRRIHCSQFDEADRGRLYVGNDYLNTINGTCFVEKGDISELKYDKLVVFWWNRAYPSTKKFTIPEGFESVSKEYFQGCITVRKIQIHEP